MERSFAILIAFVLSAVGSTDLFCPLCGDAAVEQLPPQPNSDDSVEFEFGMCCPFADSQTDDCIVNPTGNALRESSLSKAITDELDFVDVCLSFDGFMFEETDRTTCCETCTCYGDPNCVSFDGTEETWIVCDAREIPKNNEFRKRGFCPYTKAQCDQEVDSFGNSCEWQPPVKGIPLKDWSFYTHGSPCKPAGPSAILMYEADSFKFEIEQEERGWVVGASITLGDDSWSLSAKDCVYNRETSSWKGQSSLPAFFSRVEEEMAPDENNDYLWKIKDPSTGIGVVIRCTSNKYLAAKLQPRMNIEAISEPTGSRSERSFVDGFCATNSLGNQFPSENSMLIESQELCPQNVAGLGNLSIGRAVCENPSLTQNGLNQCRKDFCSRYSSPYYDSFDECLDAVIANWQTAFCQAFASEPLDVSECVDLIDESGWERAVRRYYYLNRPAVSDNDNCISNFRDLPDQLSNCEEGVLLQFLNPASGTWETVKAVSHETPLCTDVKFELCYNEIPQLFDNKIRWIQHRDLQGCLVDQCAKQNGFFVRMQIERTTVAPTQSPSPAPTFEPTNLPTGAPTPAPTFEPTDLPTGEPTPAPTFEPTVLPTGEPTPAPTSQPSPKPTFQPTFQPTFEPTNLPTVMPSIAFIPAPPPAVPEICPEGEIVPLVISETQLRYNNLGGQGPRSDDSCPFMWYESALVVNGVSVDLVVRVLEGNYIPSDTNPNATAGVSNNGVFGELGQINLRCGSQVFLEFFFVRSDCDLSDCDVAQDRSCDIEPSARDGLIWTTYDLDRYRYNQNIESVSYCNVDSFLGVPGSRVETTVNPNLGCENSAKMRARNSGVTGDNPSTQSLDSLTSGQRKKVGQIRLMEGQTRVKALYQISGPVSANFGCGRRILFSGDYCRQFVPAE